MKAVGEGDSLHHVLRNLTQTYVLCLDCFTNGHYPKILHAFDFEKQCLESALKAANFGLRGDEEEFTNYNLKWNEHDQ